MVRNKSLALLGRETLRIIERYRADKAFLGCTGFSAEMGHSTPNPDEAQIKEALIRIADETYVLADSSKYGHNCLTSFVQLRDVHLTITDNYLPRSKAKTLEAVGAKLRIAEVVDKAHLNREPAVQCESGSKMQTRCVALKILFSDGEAKRVCTTTDERAKKAPILPVNASKKR